MGGLFSGLIGGVFIGAATILGALTIIFHNQFIDEENFFEKTFEIFLGLIFLLTATNLISPTRNLAFSFTCGLFFIFFSKKFIQRASDHNFAFYEKEEQRISLLLLLIFLKNIPLGLASGVSMNIANTGLSYSLLVVIGVNALLQGAVAAVCFKGLGLDPVLSFVGAMFIATVSLAASAVGGYMSKESLEIISNTLAFSGGALMSREIQNVLSKVKVRDRRFIVNPTLASGVVVTLILIIWKELL